MRQNLEHDQDQDQNQDQIQHQHQDQDQTRIKTEKKPVQDHNQDLTGQRQRLK